MFKDLLMAEPVIADLTVENPNVWRKIGVRDVLRASGAFSCLAGIVKQGAIHLCTGGRRFGAPIDQEFGDDVVA
jgi:hypothetical protein